MQPDGKQTLLSGAWHRPPAWSLPGTYPKDRLAHTVALVMLVASVCLSLFLFFSFSPLSRMLSNRSESTQITLHSRCYSMLTTWFGSAHCVDLECYMGWVWRRHKVRMSKAEGERGRRGRKKYGRTFKKIKAQEMENWRTKVFYNWTKSLWDSRSTPTEDPHDHNCSSSELDNVSIKNI